jgi:hypothetical protein
MIATAMRVVNASPYVARAPSGLVSSLTLPPTLPFSPFEPSIENLLNSCCQESPSSTAGSQGTVSRGTKISTQRSTAVVKGLAKTDQDRSKRGPTAAG